MWRLPAWQDGPYVERLYREAVTVPGPTVEQLAAAAAEAAAYVAIGVNELDGGTMYNTLLYSTRPANSSADSASSFPPGVTGRSGAWVTGRLWT